MSESKLAQRLQALKWRLLDSQVIAAVPWSAIRRIGQSRLLSLTIMVPFLGSLLLFNQHVVELLTLSPELIRRWMKTPVDAADQIARQLTLSRLYYVYFGLTFLGFGSALFQLFCPQLVKSYASTIECVQAESAVLTRSRLVLMTSTIAAKFRSWHGEEYSGYDIPQIIRRLGFPHDFANLCYLAMVEVSANLPSGTFLNDTKPDQDAEQTDHSSGALPQAEPSDNSMPSVDDRESFYDDRGQPDPFRIAQTLTSGRRMDQWFVRVFNDQANKEGHRNDMLTLYFMALDNDRPRLRLAIVSFYGMGFMLLAIPTLLTLAQVTWHLVH